MATRRFWARPCSMELSAMASLFPVPLRGQTISWNSLVDQFELLRYPLASGRGEDSNQPNPHLSVKAGDVEMDTRTNSKETVAMLSSCACDSGLSVADPEIECNLVHTEPGIRVRIGIPHESQQGGPRLRSPVCFTFPDTVHVVLGSGTAISVGRPHRGRRNYLVD